MILFASPLEPERRFPQIGLYSLAFHVGFTDPEGGLAAASFIGFFEHLEPPGLFSGIHKRFAPENQIFRRRSGGGFGSRSNGRSGSGKIPGCRAFPGQLLLFGGRRRVFPRSDRGAYPAGEILIPGNIFPRYFQGDIPFAKEFFRLKELLQCGSADPGDSTLLILGNAPAKVKQHTVIKLRGGISEIRRLGVKIRRLPVIPGDSVSAVVVISSSFVQYHRVHLLHGIPSKLLYQPTQGVLFGKQNSRSTEKEKKHHAERKTDKPIGMFLPGFLENFSLLLHRDSRRGLFIQRFPGNPKNFGLLFFRFSFLLFMPLWRLFLRLRGFLEFSGFRLFSSKILAKLFGNREILAASPKRKFFKRIPGRQGIAVLGEASLFR